MLRYRPVYWISSYIPLHVDPSLSRHPNSRHPKQSFSPSKNSLCNQMTFPLKVGIDFESNASFVTLGKIDSFWSQFCHLINGLDFDYWSLRHIIQLLWVHLRSYPSIKRRGALVESRAPHSPFNQEHSSFMLFVCWSFMNCFFYETVIQEMLWIIELDDLLSPLQV